MIKTRFCPSPTGFLHLGNLRTALFAFLFAKSKEGSFLLRIEDTDKTRSDESYTEALQNDLQWLQLEWDEGPGHDKGRGPYYQSQRQVIYDQYYKILEEKNSAYPCFCTEEQLALSRKIQRAANKPPRYLGTCRNLTSTQIDEKLLKGLKPTLRFHVLPDQETVFKDMVRGDQRFSNNDIGDFIIRRADGTPPFMYCNAIDDALMEVTHAIRGEDHITNTPRQIMILNALDMPVPHYGHISLIIGSDGAPLSKRNGSQSLQHLREQGYLQEAIINYLARLGHYYVDDGWMSLTELAASFSLKALGLSPARFDIHQLRHWQHETLARCNEQKIWEWMGDSVHQLVPVEKKESFVRYIRPNITFPGDALHWATILFGSELNYSEQGLDIIKAAGQDFFKITLQTLLTVGADFQAVIAALKENLNVKGKSLFAPLRIALTGELNGPELAHVFELLGTEEMIRRIEKL